MKHPFPSRLIAIAAIALGLSACATTRQPEVPGTLRVAVNTPPTWNLITEDHAAELLTDRIRDVFHRAGFNRPVQQAKHADQPARAPYLLTINLVEWQPEPLGRIECTFSAELSTPNGTRRLGYFTHSTHRAIGGPGYWGLERSFEMAAEGAVDQLWSAIERSDLLTDHVMPARLTRTGASTAGVLPQS